MFVELGDPIANQVTFTFSNTGPVASSITQVYFDDGGSEAFILGGPVDGTATIPAPGAIVLAGIGAGVISLLRRHRVF